MDSHSITLLPNRNWDLTDWMRATGAESYAQMARVASELGLTNPAARTLDIYSERRIRDWATKGLNDYDVALDIIKILRAIAQKNRSIIFNYGNLALHARIFLKSKAGRPEWDTPSQDQIWEICKVASGLNNEIETELGNYDRFLDLRTRVRPAIPWRLYGREQATRQVLERIEQHPVTIIASTAGSGKTALAWHTAMIAYQEGLVTDIDWTTDKRQVMDADGQIYIYEDRSLDENEIIKSIAARFGWDDVLSKPPDKWVGACADHLRKVRHLIVVDNLETVSDQKAVVNMLQDMLTPLGSRAPIASRALITSRVDVESPEPARLDIGGLEPEGSKQYILDLQTRWNISNPLSAEEAVHLAEATRHNPLFIQIALRRYETGNTLEQITSDLNTGENFKAFRTLFEPLIMDLTPSAMAIAAFAALKTWRTGSGTISRSELRHHWQAFCQSKNILPQPEQQEEKFSEDLLSLVRKRIMNSIPSTTQNQSLYAFHPLIQAYFLPKVRRSDL